MKIGKIVSILKKQYSPLGRTLDPFYVLISCLMSHRTKDEVTYSRAKELFRKAKTPRQMMKLSVGKIEKLIYPVGFYHVKARRIKEVSKYLIRHCNGKVPDKIEELLMIKGVGRKTANIVLTHAFRKQGIAVDTHVHRISNRLGYVRTKTPYETEMALIKKLPKKYWLVFNEMLVTHGKQICVPVSPFCSRCPISRYCKKSGVSRSR